MLGPESTTTHPHTERSLLSMTTRPEKTVGETRRAWLCMPLPWAEQEWRVYSSTLDVSRTSDARRRHYYNESLFSLPVQRLEVDLDPHFCSCCVLPEANMYSCRPCDERRCAIAERTQDPTKVPAWFYDRVVHRFVSAAGRCYTYQTCCGPDILTINRSGARWGLASTKLQCMLASGDHRMVGSFCGDRKLQSLACCTAAYPSHRRHSTVRATPGCLSFCGRALSVVFIHLPSADPVSRWSFRCRQCRRWEEHPHHGRRRRACHIGHCLKWNGRAFANEYWHVSVRVALIQYGWTDICFLAMLRTATAVVT
jgi:hypothetical protein